MYWVSYGFDHYKKILLTPQKMLIKGSEAILKLLGNKPSNVDIRNLLGNEISNLFISATNQ